jgi:phosphohistidine swiveling domain-containing protein
MGSFTLSLEQVGSENLSTVGGKGSNLGELVRAGLPVPRAFCISTDAYRAVLEADLLSDILAILDGVDYESTTDIDSRASRIRDLIIDAPVPSEIEAAIAEAYGRLEAELGAGVPVSVRSSATAEDLPGMSFAGQQDTYLNVSGIDAVLTNAKRCWASLWTDRAIVYRNRQGFRHEDVYLAVVVQEMFPSQVSGVLFTTNPVTSNPKEMFLNSSWGLGEAIVSGSVDPDQYIVDRATLTVSERDIHDKRTMIVRAEDGQGSNEVPVPEAQRLSPSLTDAEVAELGRIALRIEEHYGYPQDIEWGLADGRFAILQSREVTAADIDFADGMELWQTPEARAGLDDERWLWSRAYSDEVQTGPTTPLFYTELEWRMTNQRLNTFRWTETTEVLGYSPEHFGDIPVFRWYGARAYINLAVEAERITDFIPPFAREDSLLYLFPAEQREQIRTAPFNWPRFLWIMAKLHITDPKISLQGTTAYMYANLERWTDYELSLWDKLDLEKASTEEILETRRKGHQASGFRRNVTLPFSIYLYFLQSAMKLALERYCGDHDGRLANHLSAGLHTKTTEENIAVWKLSREMRASEALMALVENPDNLAVYGALSEFEAGRGFRQSLDVFVKHYGHRGGAERDAVHHRWRHKPETVFNSLRPMITLSDEEDPARQEERLHERMLAARAEALSRVNRGLAGKVKRAALEWLIKTTQDYIYYRDFERFYNDRIMSIPRDIYTAIARKFIARGLMEDEEDIFFLGREEVVAVEEGRMSARDIAVRVRARRRMYVKYTGKEPPKFLRGWHTFDDQTLPDDGKGLRGTAASSGVVTGRARVCRKLDEVSKVKKGDILVTVATDPGWTTVFSFIGGVVVETGGVVAHAVMISREYGIPCVAHLPHATDLIPDGALITVDGGSGRVIIHDDEPQPALASR